MNSAFRSLVAASIYILHAERDGRGGGAPIRGHKRAALLRNRNRLPVIVRQNGDGCAAGGK